MAAEKQVLKYDCATVNNLLDTVNENKDLFPFDTVLNASSQKGLPNSVITKEINALKDATSNNKGYFLSLEKLRAAYPTANEGSKAYVGSNYPYQIYLYETSMGGWHYTDETGGDDTFNAGEFYTRTEIDQQHEAINNEISRVEKGANYEVLEYEVNIATTRLKVSEGNRKGGYMITYNAGTGWIKEQYIGELTDNEEWIKDENWKAEVLDENIQAIAENAQQQANLAATNAVLAEEKGTEALQIAQAAAEEASAQAAYAKEQGDLAATKGVGKVDSDSYGTGEIFNSYEGSYSNVASGQYSHAEGYHTTASGSHAHAEGYRTTASEPQAHAEGDHTTASGPHAHAEGYRTTASEPNAHAEGYKTTARGHSSHAEGITTEASGYGSHAGGFQGVANTFAQTVIGYKNTPEEYPSPTFFNATKAAFIIGNDGNAFKVLFNGQTFADGNYSSTGADYAEMFEWLDGNPTNEDRVGRFVTLKGKNIEIADETSTYILGIVSGAPTIIGDNPMRWQGKYLNDEWGRPIYEDVERVFVRNIKKKDGTIETKEDVKFQHIRKVNPNYDPVEKYIPRIERPEWDYVGMMGKLLVRQDGTLIEGGFCKPSSNGVATAAESGYYVMEIINEGQALILFR